MGSIRDVSKNVDFNHNSLFFLFIIFDEVFRVHFVLEEIKVRLVEGVELPHLALSEHVVVEVPHPPGAHVAGTPVLPAHQHPVLHL